MNAYHQQSAASQLPSALAKGVRFGCTECGWCCSGTPGKVRVSDKEIQAISEFRKQSEAAFRASEVRVVEGETLLKEKPNGDCVFFNHNRCDIHPVKPMQCRTYPFWIKNVRSDEAWERCRKECEGIGQGDWVSPEEIVRQVQEGMADTPTA
ncbi:YkgJ family cysteine cluster protein [Kiritimatiellota bacterium B12222]|nr:YkgJ family cysteine cluster protein [Kiritimatiellota bacterium B12222]